MKKRKILRNIIELRIELSKSSVCDDELNRTLILKTIDNFVLNKFECKLNENDTNDAEYHRLSYVKVK